jgi:hypothetical protein
MIQTPRRPGLSKYKTANAVVTFYTQHWPRSADGKIYIAPTQSLETYQIDAANPTPDIAG